MIAAGPALVIVRIAQSYVSVGVLVAVAFLAFGLSRVDPAARGAYGFRPLLLPGLVLLWPLVLWRWSRLVGGPARPTLGHRYARAHRVVWTVLAVLLPLLLLAALALRQGSPIEAAPVRLAPPEGSP